MRKILLTVFIGVFTLIPAFYLSAQQNKPVTAAKPQIAAPVTLQPAVPAQTPAPDVPVGTRRENRSLLTVEEGRIVTVDYTLFIDGNKVFESTKGKRPLIYVQGKGQIMPALEKELKGMSIGDKKSIIIEPKDGYGEPKKEFITEVPLASLPPDSAKEDEMLTVTGKSGKPVTCRVSAIKGDKAVLDFNHPLAGKTLRYRVEIIDIKDKREYQ